MGQTNRSSKKSARQKPSESQQDLPANAFKPPRNVKHAELKRVGESDFKSKCPVCDDGILLVKRDVTTLKVLADDICISCGQQFHYTDAKKIGKK